MLTVQLVFPLSLSRFYHSSFSRSSISGTVKTSSTLEICSRNHALFSYLTEAFAFPRARALKISNKYSRCNPSDKPHSVVLFFKNLGFSDSQVRSSVRLSPSILFYDPQKALKPKLDFFQELGFLDSGLSTFISKNSQILTYSLDDTLKPSIEFLNDTLSVGGIYNPKEDVLKLLSGGLFSRNPKTRLRPNVLFLQRCGIVGSQLSILLKNNPKIFMSNNSKLRSVVYKALEMGLSVDSRMLILAIDTLSRLGDEAFTRKLHTFKKFGFSDEQFTEIFCKAPMVLRASEVKLSRGIEFFLNAAQLHKSKLIFAPCLLLYDLEERVIPRYRVLQKIKSISLMPKESSLASVLPLSDEDFLSRYVTRFENNENELLMALKGHAEIRD